MTDESNLRYPGWRVAAAAGVGVFVSFASLLVYTFGIFLKPLADEFGWSRESVSAAFGIAAMTVAVVSPGLGHLLDRLPARRIIVPCLLVFGSAFASLALLQPPLWHLYAVFIVLGIVGNGTAQMAYSRAVAGWFERRRGMALAIVMMGGAVGAMVLPPLAETLIARVGWWLAFALLGAMVIAVGVPTVLLFIRERLPGAAEAVALQPGRSAKASAVAPAATGATVGEGLRSRVFWIVVVMLFASSIAQNGAIAHLSALLTDRGVTAAGAALAVSAMGAAGLVGRLMTGWLLDRFFAGHVWLGLMVVAAAGTLLLGTADSLASGVLAASLIGLGMGGEADVTPYVLTRYFGLRAFSALYGFTWTFYAIAGAIGPVLMGRVFDLTGSYEALLTELAMFTLLVSGLLLLLPRYTLNLKSITSPSLTT